MQIQKDLAVDRGSFDRIIAAGGFISVPAGSAPGGNSVAIRKQDADLVMDAAAWIGCGACVAACPNAAAALFVGAKLSHLGHLPHGQVERDHRALALVQQMNIEGFAYCTYIGECEAGCSKGIMRAQGPDLAELARTPQLLLRRACAKTRKARAILTATRQSACALDLSQRVRVGLERIVSNANSDKSELVAESETCNPHMRLAH